MNILASVCVFFFCQFWPRSCVKTPYEQFLNIFLLLFYTKILHRNISTLYV